MGRKALAPLAPIVAAAMAAAAAPGWAAEYSVRLVPEARDLKTRLMLFAEGPASSTGLYGEGTGAFQIADAVPEAGAATFRRVPVRFRVNGRTFAGLATVTFNNGAFEGLVADTLDADEEVGAALKVQGSAYAFGKGGEAITGHVSAEPSLLLAIPEPSTWATMVVGMGLAGWAVRRRSRQRKQAA